MYGKSTENNPHDSFPSALPKQNKTKQNKKQKITTELTEYANQSYKIGMGFSVFLSYNRLWQHLLPGDFLSRTDDLVGSC